MKSETSDFTASAFKAYVPRICTSRINFRVVQATLEFDGKFLVGVVVDAIATANGSSTDNVSTLFGAPTCRVRGA